ncbi:MAG: fatty acid desaturase [Paludisphaera borealis]|uniref:fatty acid desaturase family protein n=1 Tax=Paludisphaera borealis TaxID=1387353 RepID=UPI0028522792|nr:fatty acid desaturase [Paludisphaera borealis]MDR3622221.1 fatty acid desaturase [Paludisphaera borealis]
MSVSEVVVRPAFDDVVLQRRIMRLRQADNVTNMLYLAREYACLIVAIGTAVAFVESRAAWGVSWLWNIPVFAAAIVVVGALQHRLAGLGHESSHYTFLKNRFLNDLIPDLFCMFPIMTSVHFYRVFHMAHHQYTNDPERDPDLLNLGRGKRAFEFPMSRSRFIAVVYFCMFVAPLRFAEYQFAYMTVNTLGKGKSIYRRREGADHGRFEIYIPRLATALGVLYVVGLNVLFGWMRAIDQPGWIVPAGLLAGTLATLILRALPDWAVFQSPFRQVYSTRFSGAARLWFFTVAFIVLSLLRYQTDGRSAMYVILLWFVPMLTTFPFFMLLRDVYQHSNADTGRLTNSRVFFADPFTRWAVFVYGQDMHIPHHLFPAIPHYRLAELHELLKETHDAYGEQVVECHGTFVGDDAHPTILDEMTKPRVPFGRGEPVTS